MTRPLVLFQARRGNGLSVGFDNHNSLKRMEEHLNEVLRNGAKLLSHHDVGGSETTVLVAVHAPQVREALAAMIGSLNGFEVVAEAGSDEEALEAARMHRPRLALVDQEMYDATWTIQTLRMESLVEAIVAIGLRADDCTRARVQAAGAQAYLQTGASPSDLLMALQDALTSVPTVTANGSANGHAVPSYANGVTANGTLAHKNGRANGKNGHTPAAISPLN